MKPITRQIAIVGILVLAGGALFCAYRSDANAAVFIGVVDSVVLGVIALMQGKDTEE